MSSRFATLAVAISCVLALTGCFQTQAPDEYGDDGGLTIGVVQGRDDRGARIVAIRLTNNRDDAISVKRAQLSGAQFSEPAVWDRGTTLRPGVTIDLRVQLAAPSCPLAADLTPTVDITFKTWDGTERTVSTEPEQPSGVLTRIAAEDCLGYSVTTQADITVKSVEYVAGAHLPAQLVLGVEPTDADGRVTLVAVTATVLLALIDPNGDYSQRYEIDRVLERGGDSTDVHISLVPNRCDAHALAEDKRGTFIPFEVTTDTGLEGTYYVAMPDEQKGELYAFYSDYCGAG